MATSTAAIAPWISPPSSLQPKLKPYLTPSSASPPSRLPSFPLFLPSSLRHSRLRESHSLVVPCLPSSSPSSSLGSAPTVTTRLYVSGLSFRTTEESLRNTFQSFGQLVEVNLVMDRVANRPRGFAFLRYTTEDEAKKAIEGMHGKFLDGRVIFVEVAKPRSELRQGPKQNPKLS